MICRADVKEIFGSVQMSVMNIGRNRGLMLIFNAMTTDWSVFSYIHFLMVTKVQKNDIGPVMKIGGYNLKVEY